MIYLDNNATTRIAPEVLAEMMPWLEGGYGNPSSMHRFGQEARQAVERGRHQVAGLLGCDVREVVLTSGGTESDNAAIHGVLAAGGSGGVTSGKRVIVTSTVEHSAVREPTAALGKQGYEIVRVGVDRAGGLDMAALAALLRERAKEIAIVSIMWVNNETGVIFDVGRIGELCRSAGGGAGVVFHVDGVQAAGKVAMELRKLPVDLLSMSAHKIHGPKGVGALYVRRGVRWTPWQRGGPQERERRGGTENVAGIVGMGAAAERAAAFAAAGGYEAVRRLRDGFEKTVLEEIESTSVNGAESPRGATTTNISFSHLEAEAILLLLSEQDVCASAGAACSSGSLEPSPVIRAMGVPEAEAHGAIRFSLSRYTTEAELAAALAVLPGVIGRLRATLPV